MKKLLILTSLFTLLSVSAMAQNTVRVETGDFTYNEGDNILQIGLGLGSAVGGWGYGSLGFGISLLGSYEFGFHRYISVGPYVGFARYDYGYLTNDYNVTFLAFGAKGTLHVIPFITEVFDASWNPDKVDLYVALYTGFDIVNYDSEFIDNDLDFNVGSVTGIRYMPKENFGFFGELGWGALSVLTVGVAFEF